MFGFDIYIKATKGDGALVKQCIVKEQSRVSPKKNTIDLLDVLLSDITVKKIFIHKLTDLQEGDIF